MTDKHNLTGAMLSGIFICLGLCISAFMVSKTALKIKEYERTVTAKGLSEREVRADIVLWPIRFTDAGNDLSKLYDSLESQGEEIKKFLTDRGVAPENISFAPPEIVDKLAQKYGSGSKGEFRYVASQVVTVYSHKVDLVRKIMSSLSELGKQGIAFANTEYLDKTEYLFTRLNEIKPEMVEEATKKAREVAEKFASDSQSTLGKIKRARQGQFSILPRDKNTPYIKKVRVVSTVEYYLTD